MPLPVQVPPLQIARPLNADSLSQLPFLASLRGQHADLHQQPGAPGAVIGILHVCELR